jgi:hypothetical protein
MAMHAADPGLRGAWQEWAVAADGRVGAGAAWAFEPNIASGITAKAEVPILVSRARRCM